MKRKKTAKKRPSGKSQQHRKGNRPDFTTEEGIARRSAEGRGEGEGHDYFPWFLVPEFSSRGYRTMTMSAKFLRVIHLFSTLEWFVFLLLEVDADIVSLKEQFPLDRELTRAIAAKLGIEHPNAYGTDVVMTTDFLIERRTADGRIIKKGIAVKRRHDLKDRRTVAKLEIEKAYHLAKGHEFAIMTERDIPRELTKNVTIVRAMLRKGSIADIPTEVIAAADAVMRPFLGKANWGQMVVACDTKLQLRPGTAARIAKYLIATRAWAVDLTHPLMTREPFRMISP